MVDLNDTARSPLGIDLNEIPAEGEGEACGLCGRSDADMDVVVCDGCERGFHLSCLGMPAKEAVKVTEWVCTECARKGIHSRRWPLGKKKRILDMNASPPSDVDGEGMEDEPVHLRNQTLGDNSVGGKAVPLNILRSKQNIDRNFEGVEFGIPFGRFGSSYETTFRFPSQNPTEKCLQALRDFIAEKKGFLMEGWRVELRSSMNNYEQHAVYCSPDGKTFDSMSEVASHLGLATECKSMYAERKTDGSYVQEKLYLPWKRKSTTSSIADGLSEHQGMMITGHIHTLSSDSPCMENLACRSKSTLDVTEAGKVINNCTGFQQNNDGLPVQFEDFFVLSLGHVDARPSYHKANLIYPVGYKSCWHDVITGSLFICEVLDGGGSGPIFKIKRCSCSEVPIPNGLTVLHKQDVRTFYGLCNEEVSTDNYDNDVSVEMMLSDPCPPMENDILACLGSSLNGTQNMPTFDNVLGEGSSVQKNFKSSLSGNVESRDEIGEISVEDCSSCTAWRKMSRKFTEVCSDITKNKGVFKFFCKHVGNKAPWDVVDVEYRARFSSLEKFCGYSPFFSIPSEFRGEKEHNKLADVLFKWLDQDRFGLDTEFVQELIERLPGVKACSQYEYLKDRNNSSSITVGNGLLMVKTDGGGLSRGEEVSVGSFRKYKKPKLVEQRDHDPPPGKPLSFRLPPQVIGDFYQVWELLRRFHEVLSLREPISLEDLEEELINPWVEKCTQETNPVSSHQNNRFFRGISAKVHSSMLAVLIGELQSKVAALIDPSFDSGESRSRRGRKRDIDSSISCKRGKLNMLPINELTWPELARRYLLAVLSMDGVLDSVENTARESGKVYRCLQGDGGVLCGSLTGVAGMEADALLLAEATKKIFGSLNRENDMLVIEEKKPEEPCSSERNIVSKPVVPEWAEPLEPVRKLPTNVGTRIRKCVYQALERDPPDWAKMDLLKSISKDVYKGNASGPTKKLVLWVLSQSTLTPPESDEATKKTAAISISDIITKQCRIVLRRAAAADDSKAFCNLLGRKLINSTDNDDEGLLGSPAMVARPLDFRTIDLRLAVGAYDGSHESFLEDVRQLWTNVRTAFGDQPELVELADTLSQNFESLYEQQVVSLVQRLAGFSKVDSLNVETKKEIDDILGNISKIPKAPWDDGVCKVCGVDRDDDSVLLCDKCDAEYHTYCLDPPLARIPEGNWYCPLCVAGNRESMVAQQLSQVIGRRRGKKDVGVVTRSHLEALKHLVTVMEGREYWEFSVEERTVLLKVLGDELLSSALIHQHLEHCAETTAELQQKLRSLHSDWKNLKSREEILAAKAARVRTSVPNITGEAGLWKEPPTAATNNGTSLIQSLNSSGKSNSVVHSDYTPPPNGNPDESVLNEPPSLFSERNHNSNQFLNPQNGAGWEKDSHAAFGNGMVLSQKSEKSSRPNELLSPTSVAQEINESGRRIHLRDDLQELAKDISTQGAPSVITNELESYYAELNTIKNDLLHLQDLITSSESQLLRVALRRELLGSDSGGRLYWASVLPGVPPRVIVEGSLAMQWIDNPLDSQNRFRKVSDLQQEGSKACCPFLYEPDVTRRKGSQWAFYETNEEIERLVCWLKDDDQKERGLKESILHWQKLRSLDSQRTSNLILVENQMTLSLPMSSDKAAYFSPLVTKAATLLERNYGPCFEPEHSEIMKKQAKTSRVISEEKMYRCECLEPIWPSRNHCLSCHRTFSTTSEMDEHNEKRCIPAPPANEKHKEKSVSSKEKGNMKSNMPSEACNLNVDASRLIKFQKDGLDCPYNVEEISSKFITNDSNEELVKQIGLIGSNGVPSFVQHPSPFLSESTQMLITSQEKVASSGNEPKDTDGVAFSQGKRSTMDSGTDSKGENASRRYATYEVHEVLHSSKPALASSERRNRKSSLSSHIPQQGVVVSQSSLRSFTGKASEIGRQLKISLLDMDAAIPEEALRPSKAHLERRWSWRAYVKSAQTIYEMVQATIVLEDMIKMDYLRNEWWYWSSLSAAAKISTLSSLALRIYSLDASILYEKSLPSLGRTNSLKISNVDEHTPLANLEVAEKIKVTRKSNKKRKEPEN